MSTSHHCPECHAPLAVNAPEGLCPQCLLKAAAGPPPGSGLPGDIVDIGDPVAVAAALPQFEILELLGQGGMGVVYKARQRQLDRLVALKILPPVDALSPDFVARFTREAQSLAKLNHPNIVAIYDFGESGGLYFFSMEFVDGVNLRKLLVDRSMAAAQALAIVPKVCDALAYAHEEGVVHRDIKPENILIDKRGRVKIADFGLAKLLRREALDLTLTATGVMLGTVRYMAPEQMDKPETVDHRADIYSLGVVLYEMLTGDVPMGRFLPPSQKAGVDARLDEIVLHALEREPERRYQQASEVKTDVERVTAHRHTALAPQGIAQAAGSSDGELFRIQTLPRNGKDVWLALALAPIVTGLFGFLPGWVTFHLTLALTDKVSVAPWIGLFVGVSLFLGLFLLLGSGSVSSIRVNRAGLTIHRYIGPSRFLPWSRVIGIEAMTMGEVFRHIWIWPGIPPRGSVVSMSAQGFHRINCDGDCWYFNPPDAVGFLESIRRQRGRHASEAKTDGESVAQPVAAAGAPARQVGGSGWRTFFRRLADESFTGKAALLSAVVALGARKLQWHSLIVPGNQVLSPANSLVVSANMSAFMLGLALVGALFASAGGLAGFARMVVRALAGIFTMAALWFQISFLFTLGKWEPGLTGKVLRMTQSYAEPGLYVTITLSALALLFFVLRFFEEGFVWRRISGVAPQPKASRPS